MSGYSTLMELGKELRKLREYVHTDLEPQVHALRQRIEAHLEGGTMQDLNSTGQVVTRKQARCLGEHCSKWAAADCAGYCSQCYERLCMQEEIMRTKMTLRAQQKVIDDYRKAYDDKEPVRETLAITVRRQNLTLAWAIAGWIGWISAMVLR